MIPEHNPSPDVFPTTVEGIAARNAKRRALTIARDLRDLADRIERDAEEFHPDKARPSVTAPYGTLAGDMQQRLYNALANAGFGQLIQFAGEADLARGRGE